MTKQSFSFNSSNNFRKTGALKEDRTKNKESK